MFSRGDYDRSVPWPLVWVLGPLVLGAVLITLIGIGVRATQGFPDIEFADDLQRTAAEGDPLLADVTEFEWDRVCVFRSGLPKADVDRTLGLAWGVVGGDTLDRRDLVVFVHGDQVVKHFYLREDILRGPSGDAECYVPTDEATQL